MNVAQETVEPGAAVWPVLSVRPIRQRPVQTIRTSAAETDGTFGADLLSPQRLERERTDTGKVRRRALSRNVVKVSGQALNQGLSVKRLTRRRWRRLFRT